MAGSVAAKGIIIAAPSSGAGKTTVTLGLISALMQAGKNIRPFKVGPDYIDPTYLSAAARGRTCANLDPWAMRPETLIDLVSTVREDEIAVVEGVMGLHDGPGSTANLARQTGWPLILVIDAAKSAQTAAAVGEGLALRDPDLPIAGLLFNRVASPRHAQMVYEGIQSDLPVWVLPPQAELNLPSRHLGLYRAQERDNLERFLDLAALWARPALPAADLAAPTILSLGQSTPLSLKSDFTKKTDFEKLGLTFSYPHLNLPENCLFLPGGYPELYLDRITADPTFLPNLRQAAAAGVEIYGECGGFMVLGEAIIDAQGRRHEMAGLLPVITTFADKKRHLGYREIAVISDFALGKTGDHWRGHEFHYTQVAWQGDAAPLFSARDAYGQDLGPQGLRVGSVAGSYLHLIDQSL